MAALDEKRTTPAVLLNDGMNFHPTNKWVLFGHHFAAIAGLGLAFINSLSRNPWGVFIIGMTIPIALFMGFYMKMQYRPSIAGISAGGAVSLAVGMTQIFAAIPLMKAVMAYWYQFALMFEAFFIATGSLSAVWPMFGTANQLLAMLALCLGTTLILKAGKARYAWITLAPMVFMAATTLSASVQLIDKFRGQALAGGKDARLYGVNCALMGVLLVLALVIVGDSLVKWRRLLWARTEEEAPLAVEALPDEDEEVYPLP